MNLRDNNRLDQWLDSALSEYGEAEPRAGLEKRVMANLALRTTEIPKMSQFPSPRPLSEQEKLLVRYVNESPNDAVLIAQEQAARLREMQERGLDKSIETTSGTNQQER